MKDKSLECVICPINCNLTVLLNSDKSIFEIKGYSCKKGLVYAKEELENSFSFVTGTVKVLNGDIKRVVVRTKCQIPKSKIFEVIKEINKLEIKVPINIGDIVIKNVSNTEIDVIVTQSLKN